MMASRAILRRKSVVAEYFNISTRSIQTLQTLGHGESSKCFKESSSFATVSSGDFERRRKESGENLSASHELLKFSSQGLFRSRYYGLTSSGYVNRTPELGYPMGMRFISQSIRYKSTVTAGQREDDPDNEELVSKKRKEASPEECDQAVEGLTSAKAKAKAKKLQESQKDAKSGLQKVWQSIVATFLGIGPALRAIAAMNREDWAKKLVHWKHEVVSTLQHYWLGFKLLWVDVRISSRLLQKLAGGKNLSRRERQQLTRTTADIFRLVPFAVFIIVPFMEFLLPVFLKLFPNMLPSTFQDKMKEQEAMKRKLNARIEYAKFLQDTVKEMAKEVQNSRSGELKKTAEDLDEFLNRVRTGGGVANDEILGFAKLFNDELTLDNISRPRLVNMCKYMGISPFGTDAYLRYMLRKRLRSIKCSLKVPTGGFLY
jgi:LETM1 and EF-hand domain-containing protein 1